MPGTGLANTTDITYSVSVQAPDEFTPTGCLRVIDPGLLLHNLWQNLRLQALSAVLLKLLLA